MVDSPQVFQYLYPFEHDMTLQKNEVFRAPGMSEECSYLLAAGSGIAHILLIRNSVKCMKVMLAFKA